MSYCPEPSLEPPEDIEFGKCYCCNHGIYVGEKYWRHDGHIACMSCVTELVGHKFGFDLLIAGEE